MIRLFATQMAWEIFVDRERSFTIFVPINYRVGGRQKITSGVGTLIVIIRLSLSLEVPNSGDHHRVAKPHVYACVQQILDKLLRGRVCGLQSGISAMALKHE